MPGADGRPAPWLAPYVDALLSELESRIASVEREPADAAELPAVLAAIDGDARLAGLFGVGGGILFVPTLTWLGLTQLHAEATSLLAIINDILDLLAPGLPLVGRPR